MENITAYILCFLLGTIVSSFVMLMLFNRFKNIIKQDFVHIANDTIKSEQADLRKQNREVLDEKIIPLEKQLGEFKDKIDRFNLIGVENTSKIVEQIGILEKNNKSIAQEAKNLTEALTKNQNVKGSYGEYILDTLLQNSGLIEGVHYVKQYNTKSENLKDESIHNIRPDILINLPDNRHLIIDSKVTLTSYLEYFNDKTKLNDFKTEVRQRIKNLSEKNYQNAVNIHQPDFVLMYMPIESSVGLLYEDSDLINYAYNSNIIIVGTASLLVAIRLVSQLFAQKKQNENVEQIVLAGTNLYETFVQLCEELIATQKDFSEISQQFNTMINRFQRANKNKPSLFSQVEELKKFGINTVKKIPTDLLDSSNNDEVVTYD